jgi:hypothetical protein
MITSQEKTYQKIESLFSSSHPSSSSSLNNERIEEENQENTEQEKGEFPVSIKKSIVIRCQDKNYAYHLGEVLRKKWNLWDVLHGSEKQEEIQEVQKGSSRIFFGGGEEEEVQNNMGNIPETSFQLRFCFFSINTTAIVPFLKFWLVPGQEGTLGFPETSFAPSSDKNVETEEEEEHAEFLDICRKKFMEMGIFQEEQDEAFTTERMERDYHGYIVSPNEERVVYVFYQIPSFPTGVVGIWGCLDEILNRSQVLDKSVDTRIHSLFYAHSEILYIYGSPTNPIDAIYYGADSEYDSTNEAAQEIPYCLYLCKDKGEFSEEVQEGKAVETSAGMILGLEEQHYLSPRNKYQLSKNTDEKSILRTEDEYGFFYYFTNENIEGKWEDVSRYAVFVYNTDYRFDKYTWNLLKSLDMENHLVGGDYWKWNFSMEDWTKGGGMLDFLQIRQSSEPEKERDMNLVSEESVKQEEVIEDIPENTDEETEIVEEVDGEEVYASVYFQRDGVPLWCIKHSLCFTIIEKN